MSSTSDKVEDAVQFLLHPDVIRMSIQSKYQFLQGKGLTNEEISRAYAEASIRAQRGDSSWSNVANNAAAFVILGGACYAGYQTMRRVWRWFNGADEQERVERTRILSTLEEIRTTIQQFEQRIAPLEDRLQNVVHQSLREKQTFDSMQKDFKAQVDSLRAIMLSSKSFAPLPPPSPFLTGGMNGPNQSNSASYFLTNGMMSGNSSSVGLSSVRLPTWQSEQHQALLHQNQNGAAAGTPAPSEAARNMPSEQDKEKSEEHKDEEVKEETSTAEDAT